MTSLRPVRLYSTLAGKLGLEWPGGLCQELELRSLRLSCPCASCVDEWTGKLLLDSSSIPPDITIERVQSVGRYALGITWSDGHRSGIYTWERLRGMAARA